MRLGVYFHIRAMAFRKNKMRYIQMHIIFSFKNDGVENSSGLIGLSFDQAKRVLALHAEYRRVV